MYLHHFLVNADEPLNLNVGVKCLENKALGETAFFRSLESTKAYFEVSKEQIFLTEDDYYSKAIVRNNQLNANFFTTNQKCRELDQIVDVCG